MDVNFADCDRGFGAGGGGWGGGGRLGRGGGLLPVALAGGIAFEAEVWGEDREGGDLDAALQEGEQREAGFDAADGEEFGAGEGGRVEEGDVGHGDGGGWGPGYGDLAGDAGFVAGGALDGVLDVGADGGGVEGGVGGQDDEGDEEQGDDGEEDEGALHGV